MWYDGREAIFPAVALSIADFSSSFKEASTGNSIVLTGAESGGKDFIFLETEPTSSTGFDRLTWPQPGHPGLSAFLQKGSSLCDSFHR